MSGIKVAVFPALVEVIESYHTVRGRLQAFRYYGQLIVDVQLRYQSSAADFINECQLLLKAVVEDSLELSVMMRDPRRGSWQEPQLETRFRSFLGSDYELFENLIVQIRNVLRHSKVALKHCFDELPSQNSSKERAQRIRRTFNISRSENKHAKWLDSLEKWNKRLSELRKQRVKLRKRYSAQRGCLVRKAVPRMYNDIHDASKRLYETLQYSWSCTNVSHTGHQAKLSVDAHSVGGNVHLDMVISCRKNMGADDHALVGTLWLHEQTMTTRPIVQPCSTLISIADDFLRSSVEAGAMRQGASELASITPNWKRKLKNVRFDVADNLEEQHFQPYRRKHQRTSGVTDDPDAQSFVAFDLKAADSICDHLCESYAPASNSTDYCLGYLECPKTTLPSRIIFYDASKNAVAKKCQPTLSEKAMPVNGLIQSLQTLQQLMLAHQLAVTTLQYHSTSWLRDDWSLHEFFFFDNSTDQAVGKISEQLQSVHLSMRLPGGLQAVNDQISQDPEDIRYFYGIRNLPLAKLGVALLEIGCQAEISSLATAPTPHAVITARKVLRDPPHTMDNLGSRYLKIAQQCIDCDFSCGDDLKTEDLRSAVYTEVVCGLESLIMDWKKFLGI